MRGTIARNMRASINSIPTHNFWCVLDMCRHHLLHILYCLIHIIVQTVKDPVRVYQWLFVTFWEAGSRSEWEWIKNGKILRIGRQFGHFKGYILFFQNSTWIHRIMNLSRAHTESCLRPIEWCICSFRIPLFNGKVELFLLLE